VSPISGLTAIASRNGRPAPSEPTRCARSSSTHIWSWAVFTSSAPARSAPTRATCAAWPHRRHRHRPYRGDPRRRARLCALHARGPIPPDRVAAASPAIQRTARSTRCPSSAPPRRGSARLWTCRRSSPNWV